MFHISIFVNPRQGTTVSGPKKLFYEGTASDVILPGKQGTFEILPFHKPILSVLGPGLIVIDKKILPLRIKSGLVKMSRTKGYDAAKNMEVGREELIALVEV